MCLVPRQEVKHLAGQNKLAEYVGSIRPALHQQPPQAEEGDTGCRSLWSCIRLAQCGGLAGIKSEGVYRS